MWNSKKSVLLSLIFVYFFFVVLALLAILAPWIIHAFMEMTGKPAMLQPVLLCFVYLCLPPSGTPCGCCLGCLAKFAGKLLFDNQRRPSSQAIVVLLFSYSHHLNAGNLVFSYFAFDPLCRLYGPNFAGG